VQTVNLRDVLGAGAFPVTGQTLDPAAGPGCSQPLALPVLSAADLTRLRHQLTGQPAAPDDLCWGSGRRGAGVATGFVTVDATRRCPVDGAALPTDDGYFSPAETAVAGSGNVLIGDFFLVDPGGDFAQGFTAVHLPEASPDAPLDRTFYGVDGQLRTPLDSRHRGRYLNGGAFDGGTELLLWTDLRTNWVTLPVEPAACGEIGLLSAPEDTFGIPLNLSVATRAESPAGVETVWYSTDLLAMRLAVGEPPLVPAAPFGSVEVEYFFFLDFGGVPAFGRQQGWAATVSSASGRFSVGLEAPFRLV
jgi:hypothetical protein